MSRRRISRQRSLGLGLGLASLLIAAAPALAQPGMGGRPDPRQMSGLARVDPEVPAGTITVRCLLGGFDAPAVDAEVTLEASSADGGRVQRFSARANAEGRATFSGLGDFVGGTAIASVDFGEGPVTSQAIPVAASAGSRVMLVKGAASPAAGAGADAPTGAPMGAAAGAGAGAGDEGPRPGRPFADARFPKGSLVVGALDLGARKGIPGAKVRLEIRPPEGEASVREATTDAEGRALFEGLDAPEIAAESVLSVEIVLKEGAAPQRSEEFKVAETGQALVFTTGEVSAADAAAPVRRRPVMPPRLTPTVPAGAVRVSVIDGLDLPVSQQAVEIQKRDVTGAIRSYEGVSGPDGVAYVEGIEYGADSAYEVVVRHKGAPFRSDLFRLHESMGAIAEVRVFATTNDLSRVRSAAQIEVIARENDLAQVAQLYQVFVDGDEAFWPGPGLRISGAEGASGFVVMDRASPILSHAGKAPFAELEEPIPPGEVVDLSIAYLVEHDGTATIRWTPTLPLFEGGVLLPRDLKLTKGSDKPPTPPPQAPEAPYDYYALGAKAVGQPIELVVEGLPVRPRIYKQIGLALGLGILALLGLSLAIRPRSGLHERLLARRAELVAALERVGAGADQEDERGKIIAELDQVVRKLEALGVDKRAGEGAAAAPSAGGGASGPKA